VIDERPGVTVEPSVLRLTSGASGVLRVHVENSGSVDEEYAISVLGLDSRWVTVAPSRVLLCPGGHATSDILIALPSRPSPPAGRSIVGIKVASVRGLPSASRVEECQMEVALAESAALTVRPSIARGGGSGRFSVDIVNEGNGPIDLQLHGDDPESAVAFTFSPQRVQLAMSARASVHLRVAAPRPWSGAEPRRVFVVHTTGVADIPEVTATFVQRTGGSTALLWLAALLAATAIAALAMLVADILGL